MVSIAIFRAESSAVISKEIASVDTLFICSSENSSDSILLNQILQKIPSSQRAHLLPTILDSLGFFHAAFDSATNRYFPGNRAVIINEEFSRKDSVSNLLFDKVIYPRAFDASEIKARALGINRVYTENGYPFASVAIEIKRSNSDSLKDSMTVKYKIDPDHSAFFSGAFFKTANNTSSLLLNKYVTFKVNDPFDIRKIEGTVKRMKNLPFIENVASYDPLLTGISLDNDTMTSVTVPFEIKDRAGLGFEGVAGFESDQNNKPALQGKAHFSLLNLFHFGESISFQYLGNKTKQQLDFAFSKPWLFNLPLQCGGNFGIEIETNKYGYAYGKLNFLSEFNLFWYAGLGLQYNETSVSEDSVGISGSYYGSNFLFFKIPENYEKGTLTNELSIEIGSGIAKSDKNYHRSHVNFSIGGQIPFGSSQAIFSRFVTAHIVSSEKKLLPVELNRVGGYNSIRGYGDNEFAFRTVFFTQIEGIYYFSLNGSVFIFVDAGIGFKDEPTILKSDYTKMIGYGVGIRIPSRLGQMTLEWARNYQDTRSPGRVHIQFQNDLSRLTGKFL